jgi:hypothetical protein
MAKTYTNPLPTVATGDLLTSAAYNNVLTTLNNHTVPPAVRLTRSTNYSYTSSAVIPWDVEAYDTDSMHESVTNPGRITFSTTGLYLITFGALVNFTGTAVNIDYEIVGSTGQIVAQQYLQNTNAVTNATLAVSAIVDSTQYSYVQATIGITGATSLIISNDPRSNFSAVFLGLKA